ncbi:alpha/beta hydrolase [Litoribacillus peritrichatus]|uniref:Alpha/beta hydrolase n=1 Tax=Litoribacillus peritrichatus TaxID=718191 RepID=A0ABP7M4B4_9GAMM
MIRGKEYFRLFAMVSFFLSLTGCRSLTTLYFHPSTQYFNDPKDYGLSYDTVTLKTADDQSLTHWLFHPEGSLKGRVVFFHGNAENISTHFASVHWLPKAGYEVLLVDYRGYGKSTGVPALPDVLGDMQLSYQWMKARSAQDDQPVYVLSQSIGSALTVIAMAEESSQPDCIVLDAGFASFKDMARISFQRSWLFWSFAYPASWLLPSEFEPMDYASQVTVPVLQMHSKADQVVPYEQGLKLNKTFSRAKWLEVSGPHIATFNLQRNRDAVLKFWETGCATD